MKICAAIDDGCDFYDTLRIDDLETYDLGYIDDSRLAIDGLYCGYLANDIENRPKALYSMIEQCEFCDVSLEHIMQHETELADIQEFLPRWISYLGMQTGKTILDGGVPFLYDCYKCFEAFGRVRQQPQVYRRNEKYLS